MLARRVRIAVYGQRVPSTLRHCSGLGSLRRHYVCLLCTVRMPLKREVREVCVREVLYLDLPVCCTRIITRQPEAERRDALDHPVKDAAAIESMLDVQLVRQLYRLVVCIELRRQRYCLEIVVVIPAVHYLVAALKRLPISVRSCPVDLGCLDLLLCEALEPDVRTYPDTVSCTHLCVCADLHSVDLILILERCGSLERAACPPMAAGIRYLYLVLARQEVR